jgi:hypothetical protein
MLKTSGYALRSPEFSKQYQRTDERKELSKEESSSLNQLFAKDTEVNPIGHLFRLRRRSCNPIHAIFSLHLQQCTNHYHQVPAPRTFCLRAMLRIFPIFFQQSPEARLHTGPKGSPLHLEVLPSSLGAYRWKGYP